MCERLDGGAGVEDHVADGEEASMRVEIEHLRQLVRGIEGTAHESVLAAIQQVIEELEGRAARRAGLSVAGTAPA